ncbi:hypothetical protein ACFLZC_01405 [Patescibacteria group bacterium]
MNKKTLIIISIIVGVIILIITGYFLFRSEDINEPTDDGFFSFFFPTSEDKLGPESVTGPDGQTTQPSDTTTLPIGKFVQLTDSPISGATFNEETNSIRYFEKSTGHVYEIEPNGQNKKQITITTIPKIFEVSWSFDSLMAVLKYVGVENGQTSNIRNFSVYSMATSSLPGPSEGIFLPSNISSLAISPNENKLFYLVGEENKQGIIASFENKKQEEIFSTPFGNFITSWPQKNIITLQTKPSAKIQGYLYKLNPQTELFTKIIGNLAGLTALYSPLNDTVFYSQSIRNSFQTKILSENKKETTELAYKTFPEKCVFSKTDAKIIYCAIPKAIPMANYPDDWYKGLISFEDSLWKIDLNGGPTENMLSENGFDITNLFLSAEEDYIFFQNKKDSTLWSLKI